MATKTPSGNVELSDNQLLSKAYTAANSDRFHRRFANPYEGTILEEMYATRWQAEVALLANLAFWTRRDREQMWRVYKLSELFEENEEIYKKYPEYRAALIKKALEVNDKVYHATPPDSDPDHTVTA